MTDACEFKCCFGKSGSLKVDLARYVMDLAHYDTTMVFFKWFDSYPPGVDVIDSFALYDEEEKCVKDFYLKNIEPTNIKTLMIT